jgi:outer membrane autotransporter protein
MHTLSPSKKILTAAVMYSLLAVSPVWAANQTATTTVTGSNTAATPYISIAVSQDPTASDYETLAVSHENTDAMTVYMASGGTVSVTSKGTSDYAADTKGVKNEVGGALTIAGDLDLTSTAATADSSVADPSTSVDASAYGIYQTITLTDDADTNSGRVTVPGATKLNVSATGGGVTESGTAVSADAYAYGINNATDNLNGSIIPGRATMSLGAVSGSVTAAGGTANVASSSSNDAYAEAYGVENMGVLTLDSVDLTVEAKGGTIAAGTGTANAEAYGIETNVGSTNGSKSKLTVAGTTNLQVTAVAGNPSGEGKVATSYATAYGINDYPMNWSGSYDSMDTGAITATVTAQAGTVNTNDSYIDTQAYGLCANGVVTTGALDLTVTATGGTVSGTTNNTANTAYAYTRAEGLFNNNVSTIQINGDTTLNITVTGSTAAEGGAFSDNDVYAAGTDIYNGATLTLQDLTATVSASGGSYTEVNGIYMGYGSTTVENLDLTCSSTGGYDDTYSKTISYGIDNEYGETTVSGASTFKVTAASGTTGESGTLYTLANAVFSKGSDGVVDLQDVTGTVQATSSQQDVTRNETYADGMFASSYGTLTAKDVDLTVSSQSDTVGSKYNEVGVYGLGAAYSGTLSVTGDAKVKTSVTPSGAANEYYFADALYASNSGVVNVGTDGTDSTGATVQLEGDVLATTKGTINLTLDGADSYLQGNVLTVSPWTYKGAQGKSGTVNLTVTNGATWRPVYDNRYGSFNTADYAYSSTAKSSVYTYDTKDQDATTTAASIDTLTLSDGGTVDLTWDNATRADSFRTLDVGTLTGDNGVFKINSDLANNKADSISIGAGSTSTTAYIDVAYDPALTSETLTAGKTITGKASVVTAAPTGMTFIGQQDSYNLYTYTPILVNNGDGTWDLTGLNIDTAKVSGHVTSAAQDRLGLNSLFQFEINSLSKRLGELRETPEAESGVWARYYNGKLEQGDASLKANLFQAGYDVNTTGKSERTYRGAALSYAKGDGDYALGTGNLKETTLSLYQTGIKNDGRYYDVVLKAGKYMNDYDVTNTANPSSGDYSTWAYSISGELGKRFDLGKGLYVEPQAELVLGRLNGADYTTSRGMDVSVDAQNKAITRLGLAFGKSYSRGSVYGKASYYHDFGTGVDLNAADGGNSVGYSEDMARNWTELTIGGSAKLGKHANMYAEVSKYLGQLSSNIRYNIGARWSF